MPAAHSISVYIRLSTLILCLYIILSLILFVSIGYDALDEKNDFQFFADSITYERAAQDNIRVSDGAFGLIAVDANYLGPLTVLKIVNGSRYGVIAINTIMLMLSIWAISHARPIRRDILIFALVLNPFTMSSILSVNKEIFTILSISLLYLALSKNYASAFLASVAIGLLARWQMSLVCITAYLSCTALNPFWRNRAVTLLILLLAISAAYPFARPYLTAFDTILAEAEGTNEGGGLYFRLMDIQNQIAYIIAVIPKTIHLMFGILVKIDRIGDMSVFHNYTWVMLHSLSMLLLLSAILVARRLTLKYDSIYIAAVYCSIIAISPIYSPRYFYPIHILFAITLALPRRGTEILALSSLLASSRKSGSAAIADRKGGLPATSSAQTQR